jgi:hypothetical protein
VVDSNQSERYTLIMVSVTGTPFMGIIPITSGHAVNSSNICSLSTNGQTFPTWHHHVHTLSIPHQQTLSLDILLLPRESFWPTGESMVLALSNCELRLEMVLWALDSPRTRSRPVSLSLIHRRSPVSWLTVRHSWSRHLSLSNTTSNYSHSHIPCCTPKHLVSNSCSGTLDCPGNRSMSQSWYLILVKLGYVCHIGRDAAVRARLDMVVLRPRSITRNRTENSCFAVGNTPSEERAVALDTNGMCQQERSAKGNHHN